MRTSGEPSPWVVRFAALIRPGGHVLDLACGNGRHARWLAARGHAVEAVDRNEQALAALADMGGVRTRQTDLENGTWPYVGARFDGALVTNYLYRPRLADLLTCVAPGGVLIYETFMQGNERSGRPSSADFLLRPGESLAIDRLRARLVQDGRHPDRRKAHAGEVILRTASTPRAV